MSVCFTDLCMFLCVLYFSKNIIKATYFILPYCLFNFSAKCLERIIYTWCLSLSPFKSYSSSTHYNLASALLLRKSFHQSSQWPPNCQFSIFSLHSTWPLHSIWHCWPPLICSPLFPWPLFHSSLSIGPFQLSVSPCLVSPQILVFSNNSCSSCSKIRITDLLWTCLLELTGLFFFFKQTVYYLPLFKNQISHKNPSFWHQKIKRFGNSGSTFLSGQQSSELIVATL